MIGISLVLVLTKKFFRKIFAAAVLWALCLLYKSSLMTLFKGDKFIPLLCFLLELQSSNMENEINLYLLLNFSHHNLIEK